MAQIRLDVKDMRMLDELDRNANIISSQLAKKAGISRQVAEYRINKLCSQKTIYAFHTLVDVGRLGYSSFRVHIRLKNVSEDVYFNFAKELFSDYPTFWVAFVSGKFDLIADIFARNSNEFEEMFSGVLQKNKDIIQSYETLVILEMDLYSYGYFLQEKIERSKVAMHRNIEAIKIDKVDRQILHVIKNNSRLTYSTIGHKIGLTRNAVKNRILKLEERNIILGYKAFINFRHFDKQSFKIFIKYNTSKMEQEKALLNYLRNRDGVLATLKILGRWNLDIEIHVRYAKELQQFVMDLRNRYEIIEDYEFVQIIEDYGIDFYPNKLM